MAKIQKRGRADKRAKGKAQKKKTSNGKASPASVDLREMSPARRKLNWEKEGSAGERAETKGPLEKEYIKEGAESLLAYYINLQQTERG